MNNLDVLGLTRDDKESTRPTAPLRQGGVPYAPDPIEENGSPWSSHRMYPATPETTCDGRMRGVPGLTMPDVAVIIALVLSSGSLVVSIASFVLAISAKRQAKKAATLGFRVEAINHLRAVLSDISTLSGECGLSCGRRSSSIGEMGGRPTIVWSCGTERLLLYGAICPKMRAHSCRINFLA